MDDTPQGEPMSGDDNDKSKPRILIADDSRLIRASFSKLLGEEFELTLCENGVQALELLEEERDFSLVFTDISMPQMDGYELLNRIRNNDDPVLRDLPVIIVTGKEDAEEEKERILGLGATDLISKPFHSSELVSRARGYATLRKKVEKLKQKIPVDSLTGLVTRDYFMQQGGKHLALARRQGLKLTVARFAITNLVPLKQEFGVPLVVRMMALVARTLQENIRTEDIAAYLGTGQFALLLPGTDSQATAEVWARLRGRIAHFELKVGEKKACLNFASGIASRRIDEHVQGFDELLQQAEKGLHAVPPGQPAAKDAAATAKADESVSIDALLSLVRANEMPETQQTLAAMHALLPLLRLANRQLALELDDAIQVLVSRLEAG